MSEQVTGTGSGARVGIVMGSDSDWPVMEAAALACQEMGIAYEADVVSAHRMPDEMLAYGRDAHTRGLEVIVAGAGGAAHLPGMLAAVTPLPIYLVAEHCMSTDWNTGAPNSSIAAFCVAEAVCARLMRRQGLFGLSSTLL